MNKVKNNYAKKVYLEFFYLYIYYKILDFYDIYD